MTEYSKVYLRKNHQKRGIKLGEVVKGSSWSEMAKQLPELKQLPLSPYLRIWEVNNETHIDYGSHDSIIVVKGVVTIK
jgi:hypothetical protein